MLFCGYASRFKELILVNGMLLLLQRPTLIESILGGRVKWEAAVEEFLRLESPVRGTWRIAARDSELGGRSEEHTSELQSLMRISYAVFCLKKKKETEQPTQ